MGEIMKTDIEISNECVLSDITSVAGKLNIDTKYLECYGKYKAKIDLNILKSLKNNDEGKLILVTATNPTPFGEGKTTVSIGINDALNKLGKKSVVVLREPSLGPVFGIKGGATGGGYSQVAPMEDINLQFTGDIPAIESCNNLLCAIIDNHIYQGNELNFDLNRITFERCIDINDRALRNIIIKYDNKGLERKDSYNITAASEIMAILCLAKDITDLKIRLGNILVGFNTDGEPLYAKDLHCEDALTILLKDAIKPNLVQTLGHNPAIIHGGPFANIAQGCNSLIATTMGLKLSDYVITEAGFGSDLGAEKFLDIKCVVGNLKPNAIVINTTLRSIKYNGGVSKEDIDKENLVALRVGIVNLQRHIENMLLYTKNIVVCINKFATDTEKEIEFVKEFVNDLGCDAIVSTAYTNGSDGAIELAKKIIELCDRKIDYKPLYDYNTGIKEKINKIAKKIYHASNVIYNSSIDDKINKLTDLGFSNLPICIAKTQYSFSDNPKLLGAPTDFNMTVTDIKLSSGAGFIVVLMGNIVTMPGLAKHSAYLDMQINSDGNISGLY